GCCKLLPTIVTAAGLCAKCRIFHMDFRPPMGYPSGCKFCTWRPLRPDRPMLPAPALPALALAALCACVSALAQQPGFKFSQQDDSEQQEQQMRQERIAAQLSTPCKASLKDKKIMVLIGERRSN